MTFQWPNADFEVLKVCGTLWYDWKYNKINLKIKLHLFKSYTKYSFELADFEIRRI